MKRRDIAIYAVCSVSLQLAACVDPTDEVTTSAEQASFGGTLGSVVGSPVGGGGTTGATNAHTPSCAPSSAPDMSFSWTAPTSGTYTFTTVTTLTASFDTVLEVRDFETGASLGCNDDSSGTLQSTVSVNLPIGRTVRVVVDGFGGSNGAFSLSIAGDPGPVSRYYVCGYALPGFGCNNGRNSRLVNAVDMTNAITTCRIAQPPDRPDFCLVLDRDGATSTDESQCTDAGGSWRPTRNCCNFLGEASCP
jgi:hypothetical protein